MKFLDSLTKFLDDTLGNAKPSDMWNGLNSGGIGIDGVTPEDRGPLKDYGSPSTVPDLADQLAIAQSRTQGFTVYDISPFHVSAEQFAPQMPAQMIFDKVGYDGDNENSGFLPVRNLNAWRTVPLSNAGNFLRIEFLPAKVNSLSSQALNNVGYSGSLHLASFNEDQTYSQFVVNQNNNSDPEHNGANWRVRNLTSSSVILLQFDNPQGPIIIAKNGMTFKCPFQTIYVTFKCDSQRFSVITGFNTEIIEPSEHRLMNSNPAFGPGHGLWDNPSRHCKPFSFGVNDQTPLVAPATALPPTDNLTTEYVLFVNGATGASTPTTSKITGSCWGWITNITACITSDSKDNNKRMAIEARIRIKSASLLTSNGSIAYKNIAVASSLGSEINDTGIQINKTYTVPRRFCLMPGDQLVLTLTTYINRNGVSQNHFWTFDVEGYVYGDTQETDTNDRLLTLGPDGQEWIPNGFKGWVLEPVEINPFPLDHRWNPQTGL